MPNRTQSAAPGPMTDAIRTLVVPSLSDRGSEQHKARGFVASDNFRLSSVRVNWQLKAILPVGFVLLAGLLLFTLATVSLRIRTAMPC